MRLKASDRQNTASFASTITAEALSTRSLSDLWVEFLLQEAQKDQEDNRRPAGDSSSSLPFPSLESDETASLPDTNTTTTTNVPETTTELLDLEKGRDKESS